MTLAIGTDTIIYHCDLNTDFSVFPKGDFLFSKIKMAVRFLYDCKCGFAVKWVKYGGWGNSLKTKIPSSRGTSSRKILRFEPLEERQLLAVDVLANWVILVLLTTITILLVFRVMSVHGYVVRTLRRREIRVRSVSKGIMFYPLHTRRALMNPLQETPAIFLFSGTWVSWFSAPAILVLNQVIAAREFC